MSLDLYLHCPTCGHDETGGHNITHNVHEMAVQAGADCWEWEGRLAGETLPELTAAIEALSARPEHFSQWNAPNGWGVVANLLRFLRAVRESAEQHPTWRWKVSR